MCVYIYICNFLKLYFVLEYSLLTNKVVIVSDEQQRDSAIHIRVFILPQTPLLSRPDSLL